MTHFNTYTPATAPEKSKDLLTRWQEKLGFTPHILGIMAESPALLEGFSELGRAYESGRFSPQERAIIDMTASTLNGSDYCVAAHSCWSEKSGVAKEIIDALREERPLKDARLEALRIFVMSVMKKMGRADEKDLELFYKAGFTKAHVLEVVLGVSMNMIGNFVNHIAAPELDKAFAPHRIDSRKKSDARSSHAA